MSERDLILEGWRLWPPSILLTTPRIQITGCTFQNFTGDATDLLGGFRQHPDGSWWGSLGRKFIKRPATARTNTKEPAT